MLTELIIFAIVFAVVLSVSSVISGLVMINIMFSKRGMKKYAEGVKEMTKVLQDEELF